MSELSGKYMLEKKYLDACSSGDTNTIHYMLKYEGHTLINNYFFNKLLIKACDNNNIDVCKIILYHKNSMKYYLFDVFLKNACKTGRLPFVVLYFEIKPYTFLQDSKSRPISPIKARKSSTALAECFYNCYKSGNKDLIDYMCDKFYVSNVFKFGTCMKYVCESGNFQNFMSFLRNFNEDLQDCDWNECLKSACRGGNIKIFKYVMKKGASNLINGLQEAAGEGGNIQIINLLDSLMSSNSFSDCSMFCNKAYMLGACIGGHLEIVKLMYNKIGRNSSNVGNHDYLTRACQNGHIEIVKFLVNENINLDKLSDGASCACTYDHLEIAEYLIKKGANNFNYYLFQACSRGWLGLVKILIKKGANVWNTGLEEACESGHIDIAKLMIERGAVFNEDFYKDYHRDNIDVIKLLVKHGASDIEDHFDTTNFQLYCMYLRSQGVQSVINSELNSQWYQNWLKRLILYPPYVLLVGCRLSNGCHIKKLPVELFTLLVQY